ncbi:hypothetical protein BV902_16650 [Sphingobacterium sp. B29]|nr:hypothetical protein BV902_16650 [Sphingobacterium sp. B29]
MRAAIIEISEAPIEHWRFFLALFLVSLSDTPIRFMYEKDDDPNCLLRYWIIKIYIKIETSAY